VKVRVKMRVEQVVILKAENRDARRGSLKRKQQRQVVECTHET
jgi:hypothetical protein